MAPARGRRPDITPERHNHAHATRQRPRHRGLRLSAFTVVPRAKTVLVRDTKNRAGVVLRFFLQAWRRFIGQVKADA